MQRVDLASDATNHRRCPSGCVYRHDVRQPPQAEETAQCQLLVRWVDRWDATAARVPVSVCQACCRSHPPSEHDLNPVLASLLYHASLEAETELAKLRQWAYENLELIPAPRGCEEHSVCSHHRDGPSAVATCCVRFVRPEQWTVGRDFHRSGWPYARRSLKPLACQHGLLLDDYVEQTFSDQMQLAPHREPWVGIFHHPPGIPEFATPPEPPERMFAQPNFRESLRHLRGAIALSEYLADYLRHALGVPAFVVRHPSEVPRQGWSPELYLARQPKRLVQLGWYLRNTRAIYQVPKLREHQKLRYLPQLKRLMEYDQRVQHMWYENEQRVEYGGVTEHGYVPADDYDEILNASVILTELLDASANNVVVECIARGTPIIVNRHPAAVEYLGSDYPLYFDRLSDVPDLLQLDRVLAAHAYLTTLDRTWLRGDVFRDGIAQAVLEAQLR